MAIFCQVEGLAPGDKQRTQLTTARLQYVAPHYVAVAHQLLAIHVALPLDSTISYSAFGLQPFTAP